MNKKSILQTIFGVLLFVCLTAGAALAQTTVFTYQGKLTDAGTPQSSYQMQFSLFDALVGGTQIGATIDNPSVAVNQGVFIVGLDFGASVFTGADRFLQISVRRGAGEAYTVLSPRQQIASSPYSIRTLSAEQADLSLDSNRLGGILASEYVTNATVGSSFIRNAATLQTGNFNISGNGFVGGNLGIGTTAPTSKLNVLASGYGITQTSGAVTVGSFISNTGGGGGWFGTRTNHPLNFFTNDSVPQMTLTPAGNFGIGITNPTARLQVLSSVAGTTGIYSESSSGRAIWGKSVGSRGVYGESDSLEGVYGISNSGTGVAGRSTSNIGIYGESAVTNLTTINGLIIFGSGVYGKGTGGNGIGILGESMSSTGYGIYARNNSGGRAIFAQGNVAQSLDSNGLVKAMIYIQYGGGQIPTLIRCYNSVTNSSSGNCGFSYGTYNDGFGRHTTIDFGFTLNNRFISATGFGLDVTSVWNYLDSNTVDILSKGNSGTTNGDFYLVIY